MADGPPLVVPLVRVGRRHEALVKQGHVLVRAASSAVTLCEQLLALRDREFENPTSTSLQEVEQVAAWCWTKRCENNIYGGRNSEFKLNRMALDRLAGNSDAIALYVTLVDKHGHIAGKEFVLDHAAMKAAGLTDLSEERFRRARDRLVQAGLLEKASNHVAGKKKRTYRLRRPTPPALYDVP